MAAKAKGKGRTSPLDPRWCNQHGCDVRIILAVRDGRWLPYEATEREAGSQASIGCHVLVGSQAWRPDDLAEHFQAQFEINREKAEVLVLGYPHHRPHLHIDD